MQSDGETPGLEAELSPMQASSSFLRCRRVGGEWVPGPAVRRALLFLARQLMPRDSHGDPAPSSGEVRGCLLSAWPAGVDFSLACFFIRSHRLIPDVLLGGGEHRALTTFPPRLPLKKEKI